MARKVNQLTGWSSNRSRHDLSVKGLRSGGLRQKSDSWSGAFPLPSFFGIRGLAQRRGPAFFPVSKTFSRKRFPRNTKCFIGEYRDKGECAEGWNLKNRLEVWISFYLHISLWIFFTLKVQCKTRKHHFILSMTTTIIYVYCYITGYLQLF